MSKTQPKPLTDLEMHDLLRIVCPEHIMSDADHHFEMSAEMVDYPIDFGYGFKMSLSNLLARVCMCAMPMKTMLSGEISHCLGEVSIKDDAVQMTAAVRRPAIAGEKQ